MEYSNPILSKFNTDGSVVKINNETKQVNPLNFSIVLNQIPDEWHRVQIQDMVEVYDIDDINENNFKVNYNNGVIQFHSSKANQNITVKEYYGKGVELINAKRVATEITQDGDIVSTLQDDVDNVKNKVNEYDTIYESYTLDTTTRVNNTLDNKLTEVDTEMTGHRNTVNQLKTDYDNATHYEIVKSDEGFYTALSDNISIFQLPSGFYNALIDILHLYYQGIEMIKNENYSITGTEITLLGWSLKSGEKIFYKIEKGIKQPIPIGADGSELMNESVAPIKFTQDVQDKLNKVPIIESDLNTAITNISTLSTDKADMSIIYTKTEIDNSLALKSDKSTTYTKTEVDNSLNLKADKSATYTKTEVDTALGTKANQSTTYTKTEVDDKVSTINTVIATKANQSDLTTTNNSITTIVQRFNIITGTIVGTNEFIDGKQVYRKRISIGSLPNTSTKQVAHGLSNVTFIRFNGICAMNDNSFVYALPHVGSALANMISCYLTSTNIEITTNSDRSYYSGYVDIYYVNN